MSLALLRFRAFVTVVLVVACAHYTPEQQVRDYMALCEAAQSGDFAEAKHLLQRGAPTEETIDPATEPLAATAVNLSPPILSAAERGDLSMVKLLLAHGAYPDSRCCSSDSALGAAAAGGYLQIVQVLLENGADPTVAGMKGRTPIELARKGGHEEIVQLLTAALESRSE